MITRGIEMSTTGRTRWVISRDLLIFHIKLSMDGMKDLVLAPASLLGGVTRPCLSWKGARPPLLLGHGYRRAFRPVALPLLRCR